MIFYQLYVSKIGAYSIPIMLRRALVRMFVASVDNSIMRVVNNKIFNR